MPGIDELSRVIGKLESSIETLFYKQDTLCTEVKSLTKSLQKRKLWDTLKIVTGAFFGGFAMMAAKLAIWR